MRHVLSAAVVALFASLLGACSNDEPTSGCESGAGASCGAGGGVPCEGLSEPACESTSGCYPVTGTPFQRGSERVEGIVNGTRVFAGCTSIDAGGEYQTCIFEAEEPDTCYFIPSQRIPDGWSEDFECGECFGST